MYVAEDKTFKNLVRMVCNLQKTLLKSHRNTFRQCQPPKKIRRNHKTDNKARNTSIS